MGKVILMLGIIFLTGCNMNVNDILSGATHACGNLHVEGYFTDSQGEIVIARAPEDWTPEQVQQLCNGT